jgi:hypothetical protein
MSADDWWPTDDEWAGHVMGILEPWWARALAWLDDQPDEMAALLEWEQVHLGDGGHATSDWPGWARSPAGIYPVLQRPHWRPHR